MVLLAPFLLVAPAHPHALQCLPAHTLLLPMSLKNTELTLGQSKLE